jgi:tetratricopeptide (TPR) repeat protein
MDSERAVALLTESLEHGNPWDFEAHYYRALHCQVLHQFETMHADTTLLTRVAPRSPEMWTLAGIAALELGRRAQRDAPLEEAVRCFTRALELDEIFFPAQTNRALAHLELERHTDALADCNAALAQRPDDVTARIARGLALWWLDEPDTALNVVTRVIDEDPSRWDALQARAIFRRERGEYAAAVDDLTAALELWPRAAVLWQQRGELDLALGRLADAEVDLNAALERDPNCGGARVAW